MRFTALAGLRPSRVAALCVGALVASGLALATAGGANAYDYPGQDQIDAARAAVSSQASTVAQLDAAVAELEKALHDAEASQLLAADQYAQAQGDLENAQAQLVTANQRADEADAALATARAQLAYVAQAAYREGGGMGQLGAVVTADGFEDAVTSSEVISRASDEMATVVQRVQAAELVATTMRDAAVKAADRATAAKASASDAYDQAESAARAAQQAFTDADTVRNDAVSALAHLRGTTVALEQARQDGLADVRDAQRRADAKKAQDDADASAGGGSHNPAPTKSDDPKPPKSDDPEPTKTDDPTPTKSDDPAPIKTEEPKPTDPPKPPAPSGDWKSTATQGQKAAAKALTLMGLPYRLGGTGPTYYDCSGLTMMSWKSAGLSIQRSSQMQYNSTTHVSFSKLRKGDLLFYGTDRNAKKIYHVAIYVGNGLVAEATKPGSLSVVRAYDAPWRIDDLIPVAGRP